MSIKSIEGLPILDAKQSLRLQIEPTDISRADTKNPANCAAARACNRQLHQEARVHLGRVYLKTAKDHWTRYLVPRQLREEIVIFDRGGTFMPGEYTLQAPQPSKRMGKHQGSKRPYNPSMKRKKINRRPYHITAGVRGGPA